jgi:hypothetical protein
MASRLGNYLRHLFQIVGALAIVALVLLAVQRIYHPFDETLARIESFVAELDAKMSREAFKGITLGSLALILALCVFPVFMSKIDDKAYWRGLWRGVIAAAVYYLSNEVFALASKLGRIHFIVSMIAVIVITAVIVEGVSLTVREEDEKSFRTDVVASIASGLIFGVLVKLASYGLELLKKAA